MSCLHKYISAVFKCLNSICYILFIYKSHFNIQFIVNGLLKCDLWRSRVCVDKTLVNGKLKCDLWRSRVCVDKTLVNVLLKCDW